MSSAKTDTPLKTITPVLKRTHSFYAAETSDRVDKSKKSAISRTEKKEDVKDTMYCSQSHEHDPCKEFFGCMECPCQCGSCKCKLKPEFCICDSDDKLDEIKIQEFQQMQSNYGDFPCPDCGTYGCNDENCYHDEDDYGQEEPDDYDY
jgi:hypothetical protein